MSARARVSLVSWEGARGEVIYFYLQKDSRTVNTPTERGVRTRSVNYQKERSIRTNSNSCSQPTRGAVLTLLMVPLGLSGVRYMAQVLWLPFEYYYYYTCTVNSNVNC